MSTGGLPGFCVRKGGGHKINQAARTCCKSCSAEYRARCLILNAYKTQSADGLTLTILEHARGHGTCSHTGAYHGGRLLGYYCSRLAAAKRGNTHGHAESLPIVAIQLVRSLLERRVDDQLVTSPVVAPLLRRAGMTVHAVRQT